MSDLQQQAVRLISRLSDDNISFLIEIIQRLMPQEASTINTRLVEDPVPVGIQAFKNLNAARAEVKQYLPDDFDPEKELKEAKAEKYGDID